MKKREARKVNQKMSESTEIETKNIPSIISVKVNRQWHHHPNAPKRFHP
jgi:hypothetical protein